MYEERLKVKQQFDRYYFIAPGSDYGNMLYKDIGLLENVDFFGNALASGNQLLRLLHHIHFSFAINRRIRLPFQSIWRGKYPLSKVAFEEDKQYCVIFTDISACRTDEKFLRRLANRSNVTMVLVNANIYSKKKKLLDRRVGLFDLIFSFDRGDIEKYGFIFHGPSYSQVTGSGKLPQTDAFFVGNKSGRLEILHDIYRKLTENGCNADFYIAGTEKADRTEKGIHYNQWLEYADVLNHDIACNCIIEVLQPGQTGGTMRCTEAIVFNKKLLTNNETVKNSPYYNPAYMKIFHTVDDIDVDFVKVKIPVDYNYQGEFSPIYFIDHINRLVLEKKNGGNCDAVQ